MLQTSSARSTEHGARARRTERDLEDTRHETKHDGMEDSSSCNWVTKKSPDLYMSNRKIGGVLQLPEGFL